ncbi:hypothetical protein HELRODRAFT_171686 [Helobdella robusta]|uniref:Immunoglobulin domain-containing protein n=1 Tax=Helobdella robusta TaxID=6412 RepID=T1F4J9_HELRO|nr:hypothetical protein HELRODRAFT_171686 [Helobdella robusta]ESO05318.1 hypothetical protein HELRODRAFT_171686 [Helobdella robusta]
MAIIHLIHDLHLRVFLVIKIVTTSLSTAEGQLPQNQVVEVGSNMTIHCSTEYPGHGIIWYYQIGESGIDVTIHEQDFKNTPFGSRLEITRRRKVNRWVFSLTLADVRIYDFGVFTCYNVKTRLFASCILTVVKFMSCKSTHNHVATTYACKFMHSDLIKIEAAWTCNRDNVDIGTELSSPMINIPGTNKTITVNVVKTKAELEKRFGGTYKFQCNITFSDAYLSPPTWAKDLDKTPMRYSKSYNYLAHIQFNITDHYNLVVNEPVQCLAFSNLPVDFGIIVNDKEYIKGDVVYINRFNQTVKMTCFAKNNLNLEPVYITIEDIKVHKTYPVSNCMIHNIHDCFEKFIYDIDDNADFLIMTPHRYHVLCNEILHNISICVRKIVPCMMSSIYLHYFQALRYLCSNNYLVHRPYFYGIPLDWQCNGIYPQQLGLVSYVTDPERFIYKAELLQENPPSLAVIFLNMCSKLRGQINLYCTTVAAKVYGNEDSGNWHYNFFSRLTMQRENKSEGTNFYKRLFTEKNTCEIENLDETRQQACKHNEECYFMFDELLSLINLGVIYIENTELLEKSVCKKSQSFIEECVKQVFTHCCPVVKALVIPTTVFYRLLCADYRVSYEEYHKSCYNKLFGNVNFTSFLNCSENLRKVYNQIYDRRDAERLTNLTMEEEVELCYTALKYLDCIQHHVEVVCDKDAALLQRILIRLLMAKAFEKFHCYYAFSHRSNYLMKISESIRLKHSKFSIYVAIMFVIIYF